MENQNVTGNEEILVEAMRMMDDGRGKILPCVRFEKLSLARINKILTNDLFTMNAVDEKTLIEQLELREDKFYDNYEHCTRTCFNDNVEVVEHYGLDLVGNEVDIIVFYINGKKIFETS